MSNVSVDTVETNVMQAAEAVMRQSEQKTYVCVSQDDTCFTLGVGIDISGVPMSFVTGSCFVATLACMHAFQTHDDGPTSDYKILWPHMIVSGDALVAKLSSKAGYAQGMFVILAVECLMPPTDELIQALSVAILSEIKAWVQDIADKKITAGPLAACLNEYFDNTLYMGQDVLVQSAAGPLIGVGTFAGLDIWGKACVVMDGEEKDFVDSEVFLRPLPV